MFGRRGKKGDFTELASAVAKLKKISKEVAVVQKQLQRNAAKAVRPSPDAHKTQPCFFCFSNNDVYFEVSTCFQ